MSHGAEQVPSEARCEVCGIALSMSRYGHRDGRCIIHVGCEIAGKSVVVYSEGSVQCTVYSVQCKVLDSPQPSLVLGHYQLSIYNQTILVLSIL